MKLLGFKRVKLVGNMERVEAEWRSHMRQPASVRITETAATSRGDIPSKVLIEGESARVFETLSGLATIAWQMGWRPAGLVRDVANAVQNHRVTD